MSDLLTVEQVAQFLDKHPATVRRWINAKELPAQKLSGKYGIYVLKQEDVVKFMAKKVKAKEKQQTSSNSKQGKLFG